MLTFDVDSFGGKKNNFVKGTGILDIPDKSR